MRLKFHQTPQGWSLEVTELAEGESLEHLDVHVDGETLCINYNINDLPPSEEDPDDTAAASDAGESQSQQPPPEPPPDLPPSEEDPDDP